MVKRSSFSESIRSKKKVNLFSEEEIEEALAIGRGLSEGFPYSDVRVNVQLTPGKGMGFWMFAFMGLSTLSGVEILFKWLEKITVMLSPLIEKWKSITVG